MKPEIKITFCTGVGTVTGANFLLEIGTEPKRFLVDCGMVQGERVALEENSEDFPYDLKTIQGLFITHAHLDHVGRIPKLVKEGYTGPIYSTPQTKELARLVLDDAARIIAEEAKQDGREPIYYPNDVAPAFANWKTIEYHQNFEVAPDISLYLKDAGHILGSSMFEWNIGGAEKTKILFTGDLGNSPAPLLRDTEEIGDVNYLVMESVYGDRNHDDRVNRTEIFQNIVNDAIKRGGTLVIPSFSIDRTQVILYELNNLVEQKKIPSVPVFVDSPMAIRATEVYKANMKLFNESVQQQIARGDDIFGFPHLEYTLAKGQSEDIEKMKGAKIIIAGSGMSVGGRVVGHEEHYLPDPANTVLMNGYQAAGSLGRELVDGAKKVRIHKKDIKVRAHIETLYGYSAHKDSDHLVQFVASGNKEDLKQVFVVMGEPGASMHLAQRINDELGVKALMPERNKAYKVQ